MHSAEKLFARLARLSRRVPEDAPSHELPPALATRVLARLRADELAPASPWERLSIRALPLGAAAAVICLYFGSRTTEVPGSDEQWLAQSIVQNQLEP